MNYKKRSAKLTANYHNKMLELHKDDPMFDSFLNDTGTDYKQIEKEKVKDMKLNRNDFQECIRHLACMSAADFEKVFGTGMCGENYYFKKFQSFDKDCGRFIGYLDWGNLQLLWEHFEEHLLEHGRLKNELKQEAVQEPIPRVCYELKIYQGQDEPSDDLDFIHLGELVETLAVEKFFDHVLKNPNVIVGLMKHNNEESEEIKLHDPKNKLN